MNSASPILPRVTPATDFHYRTMRDAPAIRPFAELDPALVHWSELDRAGGALGSVAKQELLERDVRTFFGRFG